MGKKSHIPKKKGNNPKGGKPPKEHSFSSTNQPKSNGRRLKGLRMTERDLNKMMAAFFSDGPTDNGDNYERRVRLLHEMWEKGTGLDSITLEPLLLRRFTKDGQPYFIEAPKDSKMMMYLHQMSFGKIPDELKVTKGDEFGEALAKIADGENPDKELRDVIERAIAYAKKKEAENG